MFQMIHYIHPLGEQRPEFLNNELTKERERGKLARTNTDNNESYQIILSMEYREKQRNTLKTKNENRRGTTVLLMIGRPFSKVVKINLKEEIKNSILC